MRDRSPAQRRSLLTLAIATGLGIALAPEARAWPHYFEFGGGLSKWSAGSGAFQTVGAGSATSSSGGFVIPFTIGLHLQERTNGLLFSIGAQNRYYSGTTTGGPAFSMVTTGGTFRVEYWRFVLGATYAPWGFQDITFKKASAFSSALTLEGEILFPITPEIDFGLMGAQTTIKTTYDSTAGAGPAKVTEYGAFFRLNFGYTAAQSSERQKYKGWRYPFGNPLH